LYPAMNRWATIRWPSGPGRDHYWSTGPPGRTEHYCWIYLR